MTPKVIIRWVDGNWRRVICKVLGHDAYISNPSCYDCYRCHAVGYWHYEGHGKYCYTKYNEGRCYCDPPKPLGA